MPTVDNFNDATKLVAHFIEVHTTHFLHDLWSELVSTTPVKSGKARASWFVSPVKPHTKELPKGNYGYPERPNLNRYKLKYKRWYLANTAPYIGKLNRGYSKQAPTGFVERAISKVVSKYG